MLANDEQRALYSIYRYLASGKPVFLPTDAKIRSDLQGLGFQIEALESIETMSASEFYENCRRKCEANIRMVKEYLGLESIKAKWEKVIAEA
jgi:hypothetical protein